MMAARKITSGYSLRYLLQGLTEKLPVNDIQVTGVSIDSRLVKPGNLFIAIHSERTSAVPYIQDAVNAGAVAIAVEAGFLTRDMNYKIPVINIESLHKKTGFIANNFYGQPSHELTVIGITGTNGKTSVCHLLAQAMSENKKPCGIIGTLGYGTIGKFSPVQNTTPDPVTLHQLLADMQQNGIKRVVLEVSSHGLDQYRISGVDFDLGIFTNLSRDHLDYHGDLNTYGNVKRRFFTDYNIKKAVINIDDKFGNSLFNDLRSNVDVTGYSLNRDHQYSNVVAGQIINSKDRLLTLELNSPWGNGEFNSVLTGKFNAYNQMAALSAMCMLGYPFSTALEKLADCISVPGRMEKFGDDNQPQVIVDYAHTPDALEQVLQTLKGMCQGRLICVFGCGGDRDKGKRMDMGNIAERYADLIILTNDNPRTEDPDKIIQNILEGIHHHENVYVEKDRKKAIVKAIKDSSKDDIVLIAGKGHEEYQDIGGMKRPFSDQQAVMNILGENIT